MAGWHLPSDIRHQKVGRGICWKEHCPRSEGHLFAGFFRNVAKWDPKGEWVVYHELVQTTKEYMSEVTAIDVKMARGVRTRILR